MLQQSHSKHHELRTQESSSAERCQGVTIAMFGSLRSFARRTISLARLPCRSATVAWKSTDRRSLGANVAMAPEVDAKCQPRCLNPNFPYHGGTGWQLLTGTLSLNKEDSAVQSALCSGRWIQVTPDSPMNDCYMCHPPSDVLWVGYMSTMSSIPTLLLMALLHVRYH